jgi:hypothetical protein
MRAKLMKIVENEVKSMGLFLLFEKEAKGYVHFLGARKKNPKNIHPTKPLPILRGGN